MSTRPAYALVNQLTRVALTKEQAVELITDLDQIQESLTLGVNAIGELMAIAIQDKFIGISSESLTSAAHLISTLSDFIQSCHDQERDCLNYVNGKPSWFGGIHE